MNAAMKNQANGFTLVEILVAIAIIAILVTLLMPAAGRAIRRGHETKVKSFVTAVAQNLKTYRAEQKRWPPLASPISRATATGTIVFVVDPSITAPHPQVDPSSSSACWPVKTMPPRPPLWSGTIRGATAIWNWCPR